MALTADIILGWRKPRQVLRRHLMRGKSEAFAFSLLVTFLLMAYVALWPGLSRLSVLHPEVPLIQRMFAAALAVLASIPLWYLLAALSHLIGRRLGGGGSYYGARLALFTALLTVTPAMLLQGLVGGLIGPGRQLDILGIIVGAGFFWIWLSMLAEAERGDAI